MPAARVIWVIWCLFWAAGWGLGVLLFAVTIIGGIFCFFMMIGSGLAILIPIGKAPKPIYAPPQMMPAVPPPLHQPPGYYPSQHQPPGYYPPQHQQALPPTQGSHDSPPV
jgi:hypothetical protein